MIYDCYIKSMDGAYENEIDSIKYFLIRFTRE